MAEKRFVSKENLSRVWTRLFGKVLNTTEEIDANTDSSMLAGALALKEVNSSFAYDDNGIYGYRRKVNGADAVYPFITKVTIVGTLREGHYAYGNSGGDRSYGWYYTSKDITIVINSNKTYTISPSNEVISGETIIGNEVYIRHISGRASFTIKSIIFG